MISGSVRAASLKVTRPASLAAANWKRSAGNSFLSFKEYRQTAKTYGPLSASVAQKRQLAHMPKA
ncbi:hypothetical protein HG535_0C00880 [Zygotorulaspora mrakii]|uniref:Uncharacterized protein n=1 Tax=Zygotorulaspora mrakii TaxID=42260 RepID=A0A7H9B198_ZYGMR|nr:uncharacterized protein HG535_0C00880 [Zygotorulaspora mrakii]QLG71739.1 hypothetical protein HG535_0C00880 [Zygotorulaspora mrakii]